MIIWEGQKSVYFINESTKSIKTFMEYAFETHIIEMVTYDYLSQIF